MDRLQSSLFKCDDLGCKVLHIASQFPEKIKKIELKIGPKLRRPQEGSEAHIWIYLRRLSLTSKLNLLIKKMSKLSKLVLVELKGGGSCLEVEIRLPAVQLTGMSH